MGTQYCWKCKQDLPIDAFAPSKQGKKGACCIKCQREYSQEHYQRNKEKRLAQTSAYQRTLPPEKRREYRKRWAAKNPEYYKEWQHNNPDKARQARRKWYHAHPEKVQAQKAAYKLRRPTYHAEHYAKNKERYREQGQRYYETHKAEKNARAREWYRNNRDKARALWMRRRARVRGATIEPINFDAIIQRDGWVCHICGGLIARDDLHFDHIVPLSKGGMHIEDNLAPSHGDCNRRKAARTDIPSAAPPRINQKRRKAA